MLTRMLGADAEIEFAEAVYAAISKAEQAFPTPEFAVVLSDARDETEDDTLMLCRRYDGVLIPMIYVTLAEIAALEEEGTDWIASMREDLERTEADIEALEKPEDGVEP